MAFDNYVTRNIISINENTPASPHTGTTANTLVYNKQIAIAGNKIIDVGDMIFLQIRVARVLGNAGAVTLFAGFRNVAGIGTTIGRMAVATTVGGSNFIRSYPVKSSTEISTPFPTTVNFAGDNATWAMAYIPMTLVTIPSIINDLWFWISLQLADAADQVNLDYIKFDLYKKKL